MDESSQHQLVGNALQLDLDVTLEEAGLNIEPSHLGKRLGGLLVTIALELGTLQQCISTVVSWISAYGCLNIHCNFGPHGGLPGTYMYVCIYTT